MSEYQLKKKEEEKLRRAKKIIDTSIETEPQEDFRQRLETTLDTTEQLKLIKQRVDYVEFSELVLKLSERLRAVGETLEQNSLFLLEREKQYLSAKECCKTIQESILDMERFLGLRTT